MKSCLFAGTFDPVTVGHEDVIKRCLALYDKVYVVVGVNPSKSPLFSLETRLEFLKKSFGSEKKVEIAFFDGLMVDFIKSHKIDEYVRGIRNLKDLEYEKENEKKSCELYPELKVKYLDADKNFKTVSSEYIRERLKRNLSVSGLVPSAIEKDVVKKYAEIKKKKN